MGETVSALPLPILLDIAIFLTSLAWGIGFYIASRRVYLFESFAIGSFVCLLGYSLADGGAPVWLVIAGPLPFDILFLWYLLRKPRAMLISYVSTWAVYAVFHVIMSAGFPHDSLIPPWKLHG